VAGIPSAGGAGFAPRLTRVLLRIVMLAGLIVGGWLLGSATALAQDNSGNATPETIFADHSVESAPTSLLGTVPVVGAAVPGALPAVSATLSDVTSVNSLPPLSAQRSDLGAVLSPVLHPVAAVHPVSIGSPDPAPVAAPARPVSAPAVQAPAVAPVHITSAPAAPAHPVLAAPRAGPSVPDVHAQPADQVTTYGAGRSGGADHSAAPSPVSAPTPAEGAAASCPAGSAGSGATTHGSQSVTLDDQRDDAEPALTRQRLRSCVDDLPRWHTQRPSTSPD
jgi:hypothetical protein